ALAEPIAHLLVLASNLEELKPCRHAPSEHVGRFPDRIMKDENAVLYRLRGSLIPSRVAVAKGVFLVPIRMRLQKKLFGAQQIHTPGQPQLISERRGDVRVGKPV